MSVLRIAEVQMSWSLQTLGWATQGFILLDTCSGLSEREPVPSNRCEVLRTSVIGFSHGQTKAEFIYR